MDFSSLWLFFCSQSQSQQYIKTVKNLGDAWRTLAEEPTTELDQNSTVIETRFDLTQKTTNEIERKCGSEPTSVEMKTNEVLSTESSSPVETEPVRHYRIFSDYGTDFIWRNLDDIRPEEDSHVESEEVLSSFPSSVLGLYNNYHASVFPTASEEVAWAVAGYLIGWRIAIAPQIGSVEYSASNSKYLLERGKETSVTMKFLKDQVVLLAKRKPLE